MNREILLKIITVSVLCLLINVSLAAQQNDGAHPLATVSKQPAQTRPLGQVTVVSGPTVCGSEICYELEVACSQLQEPITLQLRVVNPGANVPARGTIMFMSAGGGTGAWDGGSEARRVLGELRSAGFRTVILQWNQGWLTSAQGWFEGHGRLACRPATAARWIHDNLFTQNPSTAFCATGTSGGAAQAGYMIAQYGLADIFSAVVLAGGPPMSRIDLGCLKYDLTNQPHWYEEDGSAGTIDRGFGGIGVDPGPCTRSVWGFRKKFQEASLAFGDWQYSYPRTMVWFLFGDGDTTAGVGQGLFFHQRLLAENSTLVRLDVIPNTPHNVQSSPEGANKIRDIMLNECRLR